MLISTVPRAIPLRCRVAPPTPGNISISPPRARSSPPWPALASRSPICASRNDMNAAFLRESAWQFGLTLWHVLPWMAAMGAVFSVLSLFMPCNPGKPWWRKDGLLTDFAYWIFVPVFTRYFRIWLTVVGTLIFFHIHDGQAIADFYDHGHGPLAALPLWVQGLIYLVAGDFFMYWSHRIFHRSFFWKYHAVHHAEKQVEWISA